MLARTARSAARLAIRAGYIAFLAVRNRLRRPPAPGRTAPLPSSERAAALVVAAEPLALPPGIDDVELVEETVVPEFVEEAVAAEVKPIRLVNSYATPLLTVVDDATIHIQSDGTVRLFVSPTGVRILFDGPEVDAQALQSVCTYVLGTRVEEEIDIDTLAHAADPNAAINDWYFSQPWEEQRKDRALRLGENLSVPITFLCGSQESLVRETELLLIGLHPSISQSVRAVRYFGAEGDPPTIAASGGNTDSLVRHLCHIIRLRNDFKAETRSLPPDTFLLSKLKVSFPEIAVAAPDPEMAPPKDRAAAIDLVRELLAKAKIISDESLYNPFDTRGM